MLAHIGNGLVFEEPIRARVVTARLCRLTVVLVFVWDVVL